MSEVGGTAFFSGSSAHEENTNPAGSAVNSREIEDFIRAKIKQATEACKPAEPEIGKFLCLTW